MLADHSGQLEPVELGHADIDDHDGELRLEQPVEGFAPGVRGDQIRVDPAEDDLIAQQLRGLVVDQQHVGPIVGVHPIPFGHRCNHMRSADSNCSVLTGFAR